MSLLYEDQYVKITDEGVEIKWYYFPTAQSKFIAFSDVKCFRLEPKNLFTSKGESCVHPLRLSLSLSLSTLPLETRKEDECGGGDGKEMMGRTLLTRSWRGPLPDALFLSLFLPNTTNLFFSRRGAGAGWGMGMSNVWWACDTIRQFSNEQRRCAALSRSTQTRSRCRRADPSLCLSLSLFSPSSSPGFSRSPWAKSRAPTPGRASRART